MSVRVPVIHDPENEDCPKTINPELACTCTDRGDRAWMPEEEATEADSASQSERTIHQDSDKQCE